MKRYDKYKDSGIAWIGEIPQHWEVKRFASFITLGKGLPITKVDLLEDGIHVISYGQIHSNDNISTELNDSLLRYVHPNYLETNKQCLLNKYDLVFADTSEDIEGAGNFVLNDKEYKVFAGYHTIIARINYVKQKELMPKYLAYLLMSRAFKGQVQRRMNGVKVFSITKQIIRNTNILVPPISEQQEIVRYLDSKTKKIDSYIEEKEKEISLLQELKQSEIAFAVTHGTNPNAPMKDSGIAWIGKIPQHWEVHKVKEHFTERKEKVSDKEFPPLSVSKIGVVPQLEDACKTDNGDNRKLVCKGDYVVNSRSDRKGSCGVSPLIGSVSLINIVLCPRNINSLYIHYMFRSSCYIEEFYRNGRGIVADLWTTRYTEMRNIYVPIPPISEQQEIVEYIEQKTTKIDRYISEIKQQIDSLKEYRQRLICDAVTGRINVQP